MASPAAIAVFESVYRRTDQQIRDILAAAEPVAEIDTINVILGNSFDVIPTGVAAAVRVDFNSVITGIFFQEFDGTTGSIRIDVERSPGSNSPSWARISPIAQPGFTSARYSEDDALIGWLPDIQRGDYLRFSVASVSALKRVHIGLRIRRLEP